MKKTILFCLLGMMSLPNVWAQFDFSAPNSDNVTIYYNIEGDGVVEVTHNGNGTYSGDVVIPDSVESDGKKYAVESIGEKAFFYCRDLNSIVFPKGVRKVEREAFGYCLKLTSLSFPEQLTNIGNLAFNACTQLESITISENVKEIGNAAFVNCSGLTSVVWNAKKCTFGGELFQSASSHIKSFTFGDSVEYIPANLCAGMESLLTIIIPMSVDSIGENAFAGCIGLNRMFYDGTLDDWYKVYLGSKESNPMYYAGREFVNNQELAGDLIIPAEIAEVSDYTFAGCSGLTSITFSADLKSIGNASFEGCESVTEMYSHALVPPALSDNSFEGMSPDVKLYVPCDAESAYLREWGAVENIIGVKHWITVMTNNVAMGTAKLVQPVTCNSTTAVIEAIANKGYHFVQWNDGNTENPRTVNVTSDVTFVAEFASDASEVDALVQQGFTVIATNEGSLQVYGAAGHEVSVYNLQGLCLYRGIADEPTVISLPTGIYMVQAGGKTIKAVNK